MNILYKLCDKMEDELELLYKKQELTTVDLDNMYKMIDIVKDIKTVEAMKSAEEQGWSREYAREYSRGYEDDYANTRAMNNNSRDDGYSYRRGRDSMGRYTSRDDGYSRHGNDEMIANLRSMMNNARSEQERENYRKTIEDLSR
ncbi:MAG: hypothetical protein J6Y02_22610 [Pseudobutyrivibrio sp.]|nr:hypothetical protein [Pseudobutyrivibrio sp.]